jgi:DNA-binding transcriptional MerR regulator
MTNAGDSRNGELTIDELAQRVGMTVRNIRAHQSRGLLAPPEVRGRTGYYSEEHVARIELIKELQADGFSLELIRRLVDDAGGSNREALRFTRALRAPFVEEEPRIVEAAEIAEQWHSTDVELLDRAERLGLLRPLGDGRYEELSPRLMRAGAELAALGVSARAALDVVARMRRHADAVAKLFVEIFIEHVWEPFEASGTPAERLPEIQEAVERLRPLASESLNAVFGLAMTDAVESAWGREMSRLEHHGRRRRTPRR